MARGWRGVLVALGAVAWAFVVYFNYYVTHKPFTLPVAVGLLDSLGNLVVFVLMAAAALVLGRWVTRGLEYPDALSEVILSLGLGWGILSLVTFALGLLGLLQGTLFWLLYLGIIALFHRPLGRVLGRLRNGTEFAQLPAFDRLLVGYSALVLGLSLVMALTPPLEWDGLVYHLAGPRHYLDAGRFYPLLDNFHTHFPALMEMLFLTGMLLKGDVVAHLIHWGYAAMVPLALYAFGRDHFGRRAGLLSQALFLSIPTVLTISAWAYVDLALAFYVFAAYWTLSLWLRARSEGRWLLLAGALAGMACSIKYTGASAVLVVGLLVLYRGWTDRLGWKKTLVPAAVVGAGSLLVASPWYVKNALVLGNPIYPYFLGGLGWNDLRGEWLTSLGRPMTWWELILIPWDMTIRGMEGTVAYEATISPLFLLLIPLLAVVHRRGKRWVELSLFALVTYGIWLLGGMVAYGTFVLRTRILFPCLAPLSLLAAYALEGCARWTWPQFSLRRFLMLLLGVTLAVTALNRCLNVILQRPLAVLAGIETREGFLTTRALDRHYSVMAYINQHLEPGSRILFLWEPRGYYCLRSHQPDVVLDAWPQRVANYGESPEAVLEGLESEGFTHILVNERVLEAITTQGATPLTLEEIAALEEFRASLPSPLHVEEGFYSLYALQGNPTSS